MSENEFRETIASLTRQQLRDRFQKEANSHRAMLRRAKLDVTLKVAERWKDFPAFLEDMGPKPHPKWSIDRIDTHRREYGPGLCRWADLKTQSENRPTTRWVVLDGQTITAAELARRACRPPSSVYAALDRQISPDEIMGRHTASTYLPLGFSDDRSIEWVKSYDRWLVSEVHPAKRQFAPREVYDLVTTSALMVGAQDTLAKQGFEELTSDDNDLAMSLANSEAAALLRDGDLRLRHALTSLHAWYPKLVVRLTQRGEFHRLTYWKWALHLKNPPA